MYDQHIRDWENDFDLGNFRMNRMWFFMERLCAIREGCLSLFYGDRPR